MAAWHEQRADRHGVLYTQRKPCLSRNAWLRIVLALYLSAMLGLLGFVAWKVAHPLPHLLP